MRQYIPWTFIWKVISHEFWVRVKWKNLFILIMAITIAVLYINQWKENHSYEMRYIEYTMQENDSLFNVVQDMNTYVPFGWNAQDFVQLTVKKNHIEDVTRIQVGDVVLIPITEQK